jgi:hypothetical protein
MAQVKADNRTNADTPTSDNILRGGTLGGRVRVMQDSYTFASEAVNDTILLFQDLKAGATILDLVIDSTAVTNAVTLDIGDSDTADRYINGYNAQANTTSRGATTAAGGQFQGATGSQYVVGTNTGDEQVIITVLSAIPTDGSITVTLYYTED